MELKNLLEQSLDPASLDYQAGGRLMQIVATTDFNFYQMSALLARLPVTDISWQFILGLRDEALQHALKLDYQHDLIDVCGTGGDGKHTFNISTAVSFVLASMGVKVAKHGNYAVSSSCGSSNILQALGVEFTNDTDLLKKQLDQFNICFLHAPLFHPTFAKVSAVRKELGFKTVFNLLGPLLNPMQPQFQMTGVFSYQIQRIYQQILQDLKRQYCIVFTEGGYDEISLTDKSIIKSSLQDFIFYPQDYALPVVASEKLLAQSDLSLNKKEFIEILKGNASKEKTLVVAVNTAFAYQLINNNLDLQASIQACLQAIEKGLPYELLRRLVGV